MKLDKGSAGLGIVLSTIISLFVIGIFVMLIAIANANIGEATYESTTASINETLSNVTNVSAVSIANVGNYRDCALSLTQVKNDSEAGLTLTSGNYTVSGCTVIATDDSVSIGEDWHILGSVTYNADSTASRIMNDTNTSITGVTDWFNIFIIFSVIVGLILLVTMIIIVVVLNQLYLLHLLSFFKYLIFLNFF